MELKIKRLRPDITLPSYAHPGDAGMDLYVPDQLTIAPGKRLSIPLGLSVEIPDGYVILFFDKSGLSHKHGLKSFGGVIDSGYRGELKVGIMNLSDIPYTFNTGDKIIQMLIMPVMHAHISEVDELSDSQRGERGFGSSGKQ